MGELWFLWRILPIPLQYINNFVIFDLPDYNIFRSVIQNIQLQRKAFPIGTYILQT